MTQRPSRVFSAPSRNWLTGSGDRQRGWPPGVLATELELVFSGHEGRMLDRAMVRLPHSDLQSVPAMLVPAQCDPSDAEHIVGMSSVRPGLRSEAHNWGIEAGTLHTSRTDLLVAALNLVSPAKTSAFCIV
jgi:hypothetical protein